MINKQQIIKYGWRVSDYDRNVYLKEKYMLQIPYTEKHSIKISKVFYVVSDGINTPHKIVLFQGNCKTIEDFEFLCKLLEI
jgi:hypothetical protein